MTLDVARAAAVRAQARFSETGKRKNSDARVVSWRTFLDERYEPWVTAERKAGKQTVAALHAQFGDLFGRPLDKITAWDIERFKAARLKSGTHPATVNRDLGRIRAALAKAVEWDLLSEHPLKKVKPAKGADEGRMQFLSDRDEKALRKALEARENRAGVVAVTATISCL